MPGLTHLLATNAMALAIVDLLALIGGFFFIWRALRRAWRFADLARHTSFGTARRRGRHQAHRQALRCATDVSYYVSRLALLFCVSLLSIAGVIFAAVEAVYPLDGSNGLVISAVAWKVLVTSSILVFAAFAARSIYRTVRLARQVMEIRRKIRSVAARRRRLIGQS